MRKVKLFRGFEPSKKEWLKAEGYLLFPDGTITMKSGVNEEGNLMTSPINAETLGEGLDLFDIDGVEIFQDDFVSCDGRKRIIKWVNGKFWFYAQFANTYDDISEIFGKYYGKVKIIGNLHDNPELCIA